MKDIKREWKFYQPFALSEAVIGLLCASIAFYVARKYSFKPSHRWIWFVIVFFTGIASLLMFVCIQEWPVRELCASCGRKRVVTRDRCEHCNAEFPAPARDGTEIFERNIET